jgi:hypothetical protein
MIIWEEIFDLFITFWKPVLFSNRSSQSVCEIVPSDLNEVEIAERPSLADCAI